MGLLSVLAVLKGFCFFVVRKAVVDGHFHPFAKPPKVKPENARVIAIGEGLVGLVDDLFKESRASSDGCQSGQVPWVVSK